MKQPINKAINELRLKKVRRDLRRINELSSLYRAMDDDELKRQTSLLKNKVKNGAELDTVLAEAYAVIREAALRVLNMFPKDVQVMGAIVMHQGHIAEMQTGEGKTLTATMPLYLNALADQGVFLITTNDYLAKRDLEEMKPLYEWLGLTAELGFVDEEGHQYKSSEKQEIYQADIIYTTNGRLGFDYLINHLADNKQGQFLAPLRFAIIDEIDSVILDSAQTPLVISGTPRVQSNLFYIVKEFVDTLTSQDFELKESQKEIFLTETGIDKACRYFNIDDLYQQQHAPLIRNINLALRAQYLFEANVDYFIYHGEIVLIDRISGRLLHGTKLQSGLHQAIEAKEQLLISSDMSVMATITFQNLFKQFHRFSGMTATGQLGEREFFDIYAKVVVTIPTDQPLRRTDLPDRVFINEQDKNRAVIEEVAELYQQRRPVLLITRTMEAAEYYSDLLYQREIPNNLLIAQNVAKEAQMIKEAGQLGAVTVATSMAGRGTDIKITEEVQKLGGLAVIINEHMDNSRLDKQLRGRSGRQGDIGSSQIFISLDDYLLAKWSSHPLVKNKAVRQKDALAFEQSYFFSRRVKKMVVKAQKVAEEEGVTTREMANEFEKSISIQREMIYQERSHILDHSDLTAFNFMLLAEDVIEEFISSHPELTEQEVLTFIYQHISFQFNGDLKTIDTTDKFAVKDFLMAQFSSALDVKFSEIGADNVNEYLQKAMLKGIDSAWINQVDNLQQLKGSVNNRQNGQRSPIFEYHRAALDSYQYMTRQIKRNMIRNICLSMTTFDKNDQLIVHFP